MVDRKIPPTWICPECGAVNPDSRLFCVNFPAPSSMAWTDDSFKCHGHHPDYWILTAHWPSNKPLRGNRTYSSGAY